MVLFLDGREGPLIGFLGCGELRLAYLRDPVLLALFVYAADPLALLSERTYLHPPSIFL